MMSNNFNVKNFHRNLDLLRATTGLDKGAFSELLGVWNLYRKDIKSIGAKILKAIEDNFEGVDEGWLNTYHDELSEGIFYVPHNAGSVREPEAPYYSRLPSSEKRTSEIDDYTARALSLTSRVMLSRHKEIGKALMKNLEEFSEAVSTKDELEKCRTQLYEQHKRIEEQDKKIEAQQKEIETLNRRITEMDTAIKELLKREPLGGSGTPGDGDPVPAEKVI